MTMHCIFNELGSGKTALLTFFAIVKSLQNHKVYSNYDTVVTDKKLNDFRDVEAMRGGFFAFDDAYIWAPSYEKKSTGVESILRMSRKRGIDIFWTATRPTTVHINIRFNTHIAWVPHIIKLPVNGRLLPIVLIARRYKFIPEADRTIDMLGSQVGSPIVIKAPLLWKIFDSYDTSEEIGQID